MNDKIKEAIKLLNENDYIVIPVTKGQKFLCNGCNQPQEKCRYSTLGYTCSNLLCINDTVKEQLDMTDIIENS